MKRATSLVAVGAAILAATVPLGINRLAQAQPAKGAPAAFERVREVLANRFKDTKLSGDPDKDFAELLTASAEETLFLSKTQLEYGGDRQLREIAQRIQDDHRKLIDDIKQWQVRSREANYKAQPEQPPPGSGPLNQPTQATPPKTAQAQPAPAAQSPAQPQPAPAQSAPNTPMVSGTVQKVDAAAQKITLDHGAIPNLNMDPMAMAWRVQDPAMLKGLKAGDKVQFSADRVNGSLTVTKIRKAR